tara:strand:- start:251 stop:436 length:186 start_codon:yes stop_codon:yes gene_type:complete
MFIKILKVKQGNLFIVKMFEGLFKNSPMKPNLKIRDIIFELRITEMVGAIPPPARSRQVVY